MPDYENRFIYSFEERGLDDLRSSTRDLEGTMDRIHGKSGAYTSAFQNIGQQLSSMSSRARTAANNFQRLAQAMREASVSFNVNVNMGGAVPGGTNWTGGPAEPFAGGYNAARQPAPFVPGGQIGGPTYFNQAMLPGPTIDAPYTVSGPVQQGSFGFQVSPPTPPASFATPYSPNGQLGLFGTQGYVDPGLMVQRPGRGGSVFPNLNPTPPVDFSGGTALYGTPVDAIGIAPTGRPMYQSLHAQALSGTMRAGPGSSELLRRQNLYSGAFSGLDSIVPGTRRLGLGNMIGSAVTPDLSSFRRSLSGLNDDLAKFGSMMGIVGRAWASWTIINSVVQGVERWAEAQSSLNDQLIDFQIYTGRGVQQAHEFSEQALRMSRETGLLPEETRETLMITERLDQPKYVAQRASELERITNRQLDSTEAAQAMIGLSSQFGAGSEQELNRILDTAIAAFQRSAIDSFGTFFSMMDTVGPTSQQLYTDERGIFSLLGAASVITPQMSPQSIETGINRVAQQYADPNGGFRRAIEKTGVSTMFEDGTSRDFIDVMRDLNALMEAGAVSGEQWRAIIAEIPNEMGAKHRELFTAMVEDFDKVETVYNGVSNSVGQFADAFDQSMNRMSSSVDNLKSAFDEFLESTGGLDAFQQFIDMTAQFLRLVGGRGQDPEWVREELRRFDRGVARGTDDFPDWVPEPVARLLDDRYKQNAVEFYKQQGVPVPQWYNISPETHPYMAGDPWMDRMIAPVTSPAAGTSLAAPRGIGGFLPTYNSDRVIQVENREEVQRILASVDTQRSNLGRDFDISQLEQDTFYFVDEFGNVLGSTSAEVELMGIAASSAAAALDGLAGLAGTPFTLPEGITADQFLSRYTNRVEQMAVEGTYDPRAAYNQGQLQQTMIMDQYGNVQTVTGLDPRIAGIETGAIGAEASDRRAAEAAQRRAEAEALRIQKEQERYLKDIRNELESFGDRLLSPTPVTAVDMYRSEHPDVARAPYSDKFDEPIRRIRADIENRMQGKHLKYPEELAQAQELGFFPAGIKDVTGPPEHMRNLLEGQLAEYEEAFYGRQLPLESYDWGKAVEMFAQEQEMEQNRQAWNDRLISELEAAAGRGDIDSIVPEKVRLKYEGSEFTKMLFGAKTPQEIGEEIQPYGKEISKQLGIGIRDAATDENYVALISGTLRTQTNEKSNQITLQTSGYLVGKYMVKGAANAFRDDLLAAIIAALAGAVKESKPED